MTDEQLATARDTEEWHRNRFGFKSSNVDFRQAYIEDLGSAGIEDNSVDVVISNCVINLSANKQAVFREIFRILKPGGELYFSDVFSDRRLTEEARQHPVMVGECLGGALYTEDFRRLLQEFDCKDVRCINKTPISVEDPELRTLAGDCHFFSKQFIHK